MSGMKLVAIVLIVAGILGLVYGGFTYTKETHEAQIPIVGEVKFEKKEKMQVPVWASVAAIVVGAGLLVTGGRKP